MGLIFSRWNTIKDILHVKIMNAWFYWHLPENGQWSKWAESETTLERTFRMIFPKLQFCKRQRRSTCWYDSEQVYTKNHPSPELIFIIFYVLLVQVSKPVTVSLRNGSKMSNSAEDIASSGLTNADFWTVWSSESYNVFSQYFNLKRWIIWYLIWPINNDTSCWWLLNILGQD